MLPYMKCCRASLLLLTILFCIHYSTSLSFCHPFQLWLPSLCSCPLLSFSLLPYLHPLLSPSFCICCSLYVGTCITVPLLVLGQLPHSLVPALVHPPPPSSSSYPPLLLLPILHVCQGPGGSTECTAQWPKSEYLRNCQLSPIIRGSP